MFQFKMLNASVAELVAEPSAATAAFVAVVAVAFAAVAAFAVA